MRIIYLHQYFNTPKMEGGTRSYEMARRLVANGHEVHIITSDRKPSTSKSWYNSKEEGINVHWLPLPYSNSMSNAARVRAFAKFVGLSFRKALEVPGDLVFASSTPLTIALPAIWAARKRKLPVVFEVRDLWPELPIAVGAIKNSAAIFCARWLENFAYMNSEHIVALSPGMQEGIIATGYPAERVTVIPNCCDIEMFSPAKLESNPPLDLSWLAGRPLVVYAGTMGFINGVDYLARLAEAVLPLDPGIRFLIVGSGKMKKKVVAVATKSGVLGENFFMLDGVPKEQVPTLLSAATIASSLFVDLEPMWSNSANKFFDALAASKPIMINYRGWQAELIEEHGAGIVLPINDISSAAKTLVKRIRNKDWLRNAGEAAATLANNKFARNNLAEDLEHILLKVHNDWREGNRFR
ncbi:MAG: glycosyltransferase family 4 protein [Bacteroidales bacterium]|nr:glycosyltransferase family 4 protein [Candidatus Latescibacterota bacterium]